MVVGTLSLVQKGQTSGCSMGTLSLVLKGQTSGCSTQWKQYTVDTVCSGIVEYGGGDIVFGAKRSNQWMQYGDIVISAERSN